MGKKDKASGAFGFEDSLWSIFDSFNGSNGAPLESFFPKTKAGFASQPRSTQKKSQL
jgi:hypothetical protein